MNLLPRQFCAVSWLLMPACLAAATTPMAAEEMQPPILGPQKGPESTDAGWNLRQDLARFRNHAAGMEPETGARQWLQLLDRAIDLSHHPERAAASAPVYIQEVYLAVPPPEAWDALAAAIRARPVPSVGTGVLPAQALRVLAARLTGNSAEAREAVANMAAVERKTTERVDRSKKGGGEPPASSANDLIKQVELLRDAVFEATEPPERAASFEARLDTLLSMGKGGDAKGVDRPQTLRAPDLVKEVGAEKAEAILRKALVVPQTIDFGSEEATKVLARQLAWKMRDRVTFVPWDLMCTLDSWRFYLQMRERFPSADSSESRTMEQEQATGYAILGAAMAGESDTSRRLLKELAKFTAAHDGKLNGFFGRYIWQEAVDAGGSDACWAVFDWLARTEPAICDWEAYEDAALRTGHLEPAIAVMEEAAQRKSGKPSRRLREALADALLAADHPAEAILLLRDQALAEPGLNIEPQVMEEIRKAGKSFERLSERKQEAYVLLVMLGKLFDAAESGETAGPGEHLEHLGRVANLARLSGEWEIFDQMSQTMIGSKDLLEQADFTFDHKFGLGLVPLLLEAGRGRDLEPRLKRWLTASAKEDATPRSGLDAALSDIHGARSWPPALRLVEFYEAGSREREIVDLFDQGRFWPTDDLAGVLNHLHRENLSDEPETFGYTAAHALALAGRTEPALATLNAALEMTAAPASAYELLLQLMPPAAAAARLDELSSLQPLEAGPLIWKAQLRLREGRTQEAEACARRALSLIPFDAYRGGDRARAWSLLAQALAGRDDLEAVRARQRAEALRYLPEVVELEEAGLHTRALARCQSAHDKFGEDFGIEWKLGLH